MKSRTSTLVALIGAVTIAGVTMIRAQQPQAPVAPAGPLAPEKFKDIQALKDIPADQLDTTMRYFSAALGYQCQNCHMTDRATGVIDFAAPSNGKTEARKMIAMVRSVNTTTDDFGTKISCATCHQGHNQPQNLQPAQMMTPDQITQFNAQQAAIAARQGGAGPGGAPGGAPGQPPAGARAGAPPQGAAPGQPGQPGGGRGNQPAAPPVDDVLNKYIDGLGGSAALGKIQTRVMTGTVTTRAAQTFPFTIEEKAGKYRESVQSTPAARTVAFSGASGWVQNGTFIGDVEGFTLQQAQRNADLTLPTTLKTRCTALTAGRPQQLRLAAGAPPIDVNFLTCTTAPNVTERLYFDATSGLLLRRQSSTRTPSVLNGVLTEIYDYSDYRDVSGVKMPFTIKRTNWNTLDTLTVSDIKVNTAIDDGRFSKSK